MKRGTTTIAHIPQDLSEEDLLRAAFEEGYQTELSSLVPIVEELKRFVGVMSVASANNELPLPFWTDNYASFPILWRIARRILPTPASSTDVERLFSVCGLICTDGRSKLTPTHVNTLASLNIWIRESLGYRSVVSEKSEQSARRYVTLNADLEMNVPDYCSDEEED